MACRPQTIAYYDLKLLEKDRLPFDEEIESVRKKKEKVLHAFRLENRVWPNLFDVTPHLIETLEEEGKKHIQKIRAHPEKFGYFYMLAKHNIHLYNAPRFDYKNFPLMTGQEDVLRSITKMARTFHKELTLEFDATCLYLLYFYALLVNPSLNWITVDYLANGNRYHQHGTKLKGKFKMRSKYVFTRED